MNLDKEMKYLSIIRKEHFLKIMWAVNDGKFGNTPGTRLDFLLKNSLKKIHNNKKSGNPPQWVPGGFQNFLSLMAHTVYCLYILLRISQDY